MSDQPLWLLGAFVFGLLLGAMITTSTSPKLTRLMAEANELQRLRRWAKRYDTTMDVLERAPDGDDYNELLAQVQP